jgi:hypothetical protein
LRSNKIAAGSIGQAMDRMWSAGRQFDTPGLD